MDRLTVPNGGLTLHDSPDSMSEEKKECNSLQIMRLDLADGVLDDIIKSARHGGKDVNVLFGKTITLHYGNRTQHLTASPFPSHSNLYDCPSEDPTNLALAGRLSHKLAMEKAREEIAGADEALAKLQSQLASHEKAKQSMQIKYVPDGSNLPPARKLTAAAVKRQSVKTNSLSFLKKNNNNNRLHPNHDTTRSMPASPSLGPRAAPAQKVKLTSVPGFPNAKNQRLQALRVPLIHFLAARPASEKLLSQHLRCRQEEILEVLQKVGKPYRLDNSKWDLTDKAFKELDIWAFDYSDQHDRELAVNRARSAFDRMRLSTQEKLWDKLLPKEERGKGKILSHLNLHKGPIQKPTTPKIHVQPSTNDSEEPKAHQIVGYESDQKDRLAPSDAEPMARSKSQNPLKKTKLSEKEAQSKRLLSKGPKKSTSEPKAKEAHPAVRKGGPQKKNAPKSSEFVNDSDEEDGLDETVTNASASHGQKLNHPVQRSPKADGSSHSEASSTKAKVTKKPNNSVKASKPSFPAKPNGVKASNSDPVKTKSTITPASKDGKHDRPDSSSAKVSEKKPLPSSSSTPAMKPHISNASPSSTAMKKSLSRQRTTSSPHKPSPLGSSPPTNASDFDNGGRSSHSSLSLSTPARKTIATPNGVGLGINGHARNSSDQSLKRKANDLDSDIHDHTSPLVNGVINGYVNGYIDGDTSPSKRRKTGNESPNSDSGDESLARDVALKKAQDFKKYYANYQKQYRDISQMSSAPQEKVDELMKMHRRLEELKEQITRGLVGI